MVGKHRIGRPGDREVATEDDAAQLVVAALGAERLELVVEVEHHGWRREPPRRAACLRVKPDDEECLAAKTHREMRIFGVVCDARIGALAKPLVLVAERLEPAPQPLLEASLVTRRAGFEQHNQRLEQFGLGAIAFRKVEQRWQDPQIIPSRPEISRNDEAHPITLQRRFGAYARKGTVSDEQAELVRERIVAVIISCTHVNKTALSPKGCGDAPRLPLASPDARG